MEEISWYLPDGLGQIINNISQDVSWPKFSEYEMSVLTADGDSVST
jgi:hypothetical protein